MEIIKYFEEMSGFFVDKELVIPAAQMVYYVIIINLLMLFQRYRTCFLISLSFALYWLCVLNEKTFISAVGDFSGMGYFYLGGGMFVLMIAMFFFFTQSASSDS
ncbi:MAG: hypothetical protein KKB30_03450 [Proteobacteria bacterium]|nr:hypothetical protein [Pseudomonadota bacterium]MBU1715048.1 hypothetical protein [Pseudomonadota bacterium]